MQFALSLLMTRSLAGINILASDHEWQVITSVASDRVNYFRNQMGTN